jgi:hypothetical protein
MPKGPVPNAIRLVVNPFINSRFWIFRPGLVHQIVFLLSPLDDPRMIAAGGSANSSVAVVK